MIHYSLNNRNENARFLGSIMKINDKENDKDEILVRGGTHIGVSGMYGEVQFKSHDELRTYVQNKYPESMYGKGVKWGQYYNKKFDKITYIWQDENESTIFEYQVIEGQEYPGSKS